jgi:predicted nucleic acid-binding protein
MNAKPFLDTNILVYAFASNDPRGSKAEALLATGGVISFQVLNEFVNVSRRKLAREWAEIEDALGVLRTILDPPIALTIDLHEAAIRLARDHGFPFYDSLIIAAAIRAGCRNLYSEDMQDGQTVDGVTLRNPFA